MPIPKTKNKPRQDIGRMKVLLHSFPKFGKSTWAASIPDSIFLATEPGLGCIEAMRWEDEKGNYVIDTWPKLMEATREVVEAGCFKTVIIDTLDMALEMCKDHICERAGEKYHTDGTLSYGKGSAMIIAEMRRYLVRLGSIDMGVVLLSHTVQETIHGRTGEYQKAVPNVPEKHRRPILGMMDLILYGDMEREKQGDNYVAKRVLRTKPHPHWEAGDRSGVLPTELPLDWTVLSKSFVTTPPSKTETD